MDKLIEMLEGYTQNETLIDRNEYYNSIEQIAAYSVGKSDGMTSMARMVLKYIKEKTE